MTEFEKKREKSIIEKDQSLSGYGTKYSSVCVIRIPEGKEKKMGTEKIEQVIVEDLKFCRKK